MLPSPCINVCKMDAGNGLCQGCFRTLDEITQWARASEAAQAAILAAVAERRAQHGTSATPSLRPTAHG